MALYHSAKGSENYTIVGNPIIVNGVVSGFSQNDRITFPNLPSSKVEGVIKAHTDLSYTGDQFLFYSFYNNSTKQFGIRKTAEGKLRLWMGSDGVEISNIADNTDYWIKFYYYNGTASLSVSTNGISYSAPVSFSVTDTPSTSFTGVRIGAGSSSSNYWYSSVDLSQTYIMANEQPWFGVCPVEVQKHQIMGPVGYTVVGSPTITDGVASGFSTNNYLQVAYQDFNTNTNDFESNACFSLSQLTTSCVIMHYSSVYGSLVVIPQNNRVFAIILKEGTSSYYTAAATNITFQANTFYNAKTIIKNNVVTLIISDVNGQVISQGASTSMGDDSLAYISGVRIGVGHPEYTDTNYVSVNLNETYIKVNGKLWFWQPQETKKIIVNGVEVYNKATPTSTKLLAHFDGNWKEEVSGQNITKYEPTSSTWNPTFGTDSYCTKWGQALKFEQNDLYGEIYFPQEIVLEPPFTIEMQRGWNGQRNRNWMLFTQSGGYWDDNYELMKVKQAFGFGSRRNGVANMHYSIPEYTPGFVSNDTPYMDYTNPHHSAITVDENKIMRGFLDGQLIGTLDISGNYTTPLVCDKIQIVGDSGWGMDEVCISNVCKWTTNFTPPSSPYSL